MKHPKFSHAFEVIAELPDALKPLKKLVSNYRWTWHHETRELFRSIDKVLWEEAMHNPVAVLGKLSNEKLSRLTEDSLFIAKLKHCEKDLDDYLSCETWFDQEYPNQRDQTTIAYFCAEFGISESLPIYSGGLGVLAGDHLKAASDSGLPLVAVGLLYARGYFQQRLNHDGWQQEIYSEYDYYQMPLTLVRGEDTEPLRIDVELPDRMVTCQVWRADVGRIPLYLLDSNVLENAPTDQGITDTLYGGGEEMRIRQEMILGIGGMRALRAIGIKPTVCHMNEGHAAFLSLERIRQFMEEHQTDFRTARQAVVAGNVFTTHTPVPAGFDLFPADLLEQYIGKTVNSVGLKFNDFLKLGKMDVDNEGEPFNMAVLAMGNSNYVNGVSKLHARVTRSMFQPRWPQLPEDEVPIEAITNGVHAMTWIGKRMADLFDEFLDPTWKRNTADPDIWQSVFDIPDHRLWSVLENQRGDLVRFIRKRLQERHDFMDIEQSDFGSTSGILDPRILTIGFARRFATYKRANLMLADRDRILHFLNHAERPIQVVIAGKAHPRDDGGKKIIQDLVQFINSSSAKGRMVFLEDYDMMVARYLVQGVDLWLNNPRRPMEASGTSGMKVVPNGGLNCSILDGWWDEGYDSGLGFAIGNREEYSDHSQQDWLDSNSLYGLLENDITPKFYSRLDKGIPTAWVAMVKRSIAQLAPAFSTARMVREYAKKFYMPSSTGYNLLVENDLAKAKEVLAWRDKTKSAWPGVRVVNVHDNVGSTPPVGKEFKVSALIDLNGLSPDEVCVQAVLGRIGPNRDLVNTEAFTLNPVGEEDGAFRFEMCMKCKTPGHQGYTIRVMPHHDNVQVLSELPLVTWESSH